MLNKFRRLIAQPVAQIISSGPEDVSIKLESPKRAGHGQLALPVFSWAKEKKMSPPQLAQTWAQLLTGKLPKEVARVEAVAGFLNFHFSAECIQDTICEIFKSKQMIGHSSVGDGKRLVIDFSSPNVAKPMHLGHLRATMIGQAIVNLAKTQGFEVIGLNHLGDWGVQFGKLAWAFQKWGHEYPFKEKPFESLFALYVRFSEEAEKNPTLDKEGSLVFKRLEDGDPEIEKVWRMFVDISMQDYTRIWHSLGVRHDLVRGESFYNDRLKPTEALLDKAGLLVESEGAMVVNLDSEGMPPCLIRKSDGASLYATRDLASALYRHDELRADLNLYVVGVDQTLHFRQVFAVLEKLGLSWAKSCHHVAFGMYRFRDARMSTRKGNVVFLEDVLQKSVELVREIIAEKNPQLQNAQQVAQQVGYGAVIFNDLVNDRVKDVDFDWQRLLDFEGDSGPYVQYCAVRCNSLIKKYQKPIPERMELLLTSLEEQEIARILLNYQDTLSNAFEHFKPHFLANYLLDLCHAFNQFYNKHRILGEEPKLEQSRMVLVQTVHLVLRSGLGVLNIAIPEAM